MTWSSSRISERRVGECSEVRGLKPKEEHITLRKFANKADWTKGYLLHDTQPLLMPLTRRGKGEAGGEGSVFLRAFFIAFCFFVFAYLSFS